MKSSACLTLTDSNTDKAKAKQMSYLQGLVSKEHEWNDRDVMYTHP
jgi:hypothetical protein